MKLLKIVYHVIAILKILLYKFLYGNRIRIGRGTTFRSQFNIDFDSKSGGRILIGDFCFFNRCCTLSSQGVIVIGNDCLFGENVKFYDHNHKFYLPKAVRKQGYSSGEIHIGDNCWVGSNVVFLKGANVGEHCVIGAGCVIDSVIPANTIVKGSRELSLQPIITKLSY